MKKLASVVGILIAGIGLVGLVAPLQLLSAVQSLLSPGVLYGTATVRLLAGAILLSAAPQSRIPTGLRILGLVLVLNGLVTALLGFQRASDLLAWATIQNTVLIRVGAALAVAVGVFVVYAVGTTAAGRNRMPADS